MRLRGDQGEVVEAKLVAVAHHHGAVDRVFKLADVAGPIELGEVRNSLAADAGDGAVLLRGKAGQEMPEEMWNVLAPGAQRGDRQRQHVQAIEQVFPEVTLLDPLKQPA